MHSKRPRLHVLLSYIANRPHPHHSPLASLRAHINSASILPRLPIWIPALTTSTFISAPLGRTGLPASTPRTPSATPEATPPPRHPTLPRCAMLDLCVETAVFVGLRRSDARRHGAYHSDIRDGVRGGADGSSREAPRWSSRVVVGTRRFRDFARGYAAPFGDLARWMLYHIRIVTSQKDWSRGSFQALSRSGA